MGYVFPIVIWPEFRMRQYRDDDHREDAPHFINGIIGKNIKMYSISMQMINDKNESMAKMNGMT